jgi:hypothetical protein
MERCALSGRGQRKERIGSKAAGEMGSSFINAGLRTHVAEKIPITKKRIVMSLCLSWKYTPFGKSSKALQHSNPTSPLLPCSQAKAISSPRFAPEHCSACPSSTYWSSQQVKDKVVTDSSHPPPNPAAKGNSAYCDKIRIPRRMNIISLSMAGLA